MNRWILCSLPFVIGAALLVPAAHAQNTDSATVCSDMTIAGDYAVRISGVGFQSPVPTPPMPPTISVYFDGVAIAHFDGNGNFTQQDFVLRNGGFTPVVQNPNGNKFNIDESGTYHVFSDCTAEATINFRDDIGTLITVINLRAVIGENGRIIHTVVSRLQTLINGSLVTIPVNTHSDGERVQVQ